MKITIETDDLTVTVSDSGDVNLNGALTLYENALRAVGFYFDGRLEIMDLDDGCKGDKETK